MFPKVLPTILTLKNAASLISVASVHSGRRSFYQSQVVKNEIPDGKKQYYIINTKLNTYLYFFRIF